MAETDAGPLIRNRGRLKVRQNSSLIKGLRILEYVAASPSGLKLSDIAREVNLPTSNLTLFLNSLVEMGYVIKNLVDGRYYISDRIDRLAKKITTSRYIQLESVAEKEMAHLHRKFDENTLLAVLNNFRLQFILTLQSSRNVQILNNDDKLFIPHVTAAGKAILAHLDEDLLRSYFQNAALQRFTAKTSTNAGDIMKELEEVRERGYAINRGEYEELVMAVAAPIFQNEKVTASVVVQFPTFRYQEERLPNFANDVMSSAKSIERKLNSLPGFQLK